MKIVMLVPLSLVVEAAFSLYNPQSGKCLDDAVSTGNVEIWTCHGGSNQKWSYVNGALKNSANGKCLDIQINANVQVYSCNGSPEQTWYFSGSTIRNSKSGLCLDAHRGRTDSGSNVDAYACNGTPAQVWNNIGAGDSCQEVGCFDGSNFIGCCPRTAPICDTINKTCQSSLGNASVAMISIVEEFQV